MRFRPLMIKTFVKENRNATWKILLNRNKCSSSEFLRNTKTLLPFSLLASSFITIEDDEKEEPAESRDSSAKVVLPEPKEFSNTFQMQQAASNGLNSSMQLLSSSFRSWHIAHQTFAATLERATNALTIAIDMESVVLEQLGFEEKLTLIKTDLVDQKAVLSDCLFVYQEVVKMANLAASISFLVGLEAASGLALSTLYNVQQEVISVFNQIYTKTEINLLFSQLDKMKREGEKLEQRYLELQKEFITKRGKEW